MRILTDTNRCRVTPYTTPPPSHLVHGLRTGTFPFIHRNVSLSLKRVHCAPGTRGLHPVPNCARMHLDSGTLHALHPSCTNVVNIEFI